MPLSEHEENVLAEIERQLAAEDPHFASRARRKLGVSRLAQQRLSIVMGAIGIVAVLSLGFVPAPWNLVVPAIGFLLLLGGIILGVTARRAPADDVRSFVPPDDRA